MFIFQKRWKGFLFSLRYLITSKIFVYNATSNGSLCAHDFLSESPFKFIWYFSSEIIYFVLDIGSYIGCDRCERVEVSLD